MPTAAGAYVLRVPQRVAVDRGLDFFVRQGHVSGMMPSVASECRQILFAWRPFLLFGLGLNVQVELLQ